MIILLSILLVVFAGIFMFLLFSVIINSQSADIILLAMTAVCIAALSLLYYDLYPSYKINQSMKKQKPINAKLAYMALRSGYKVKHESFCYGNYLKLEGQIIYKHLNSNKITWSTIDKLPEHFAKGPFGKNYYILKD